MPVCMYVYVCMYVGTCICMYVCMYDVCMYVCTYICMNVCMYLSVRICMYAFMYACVYEYVYIDVCIYMYNTYMQTTTAQKQQNASQQKTTRIILTLVVVYLVCWCPSIAILNLMDFSFTTAAISQLLVVLNSFLDPLLYIIQIKEFRERIARMLCCCIPSIRNSSVGQSTVGGRQTAIMSITETKNL